MHMDTHTCTCACACCVCTRPGGDHAHATRPHPCRYALERCLGWSGVLIEADPISFAKLVASKRNATRVHSAVCDEQTGTIPMTIGRGALSGSQAGFTRGHAARWGFGTNDVIKLIPCKPLHVILRAAGHASGGADFLSLDVEGAEEMVLRNALPGAFKVVLVETDGDRPAKEAAVRGLLEAAGHVLTHELRLGYRKHGGWSQVYMQKRLAAPLGFAAEGAGPMMVLSPMCNHSKSCSAAAATPHDSQLLGKRTIHARAHAD